MTWLVVAPRREGDEVLRLSAWIAEQNAALRSADVRHLTGEAVERSRVTESLTAEVEGIAFFGHGRQDALVGSSREPLIDGDNLSALAGRWLHALACSAAVGLGPQAMEAGLATFVGYRTELVPSFDLPPPAEAQFIALVTSTTRALLAGEREQEKLQSDASLAWYAFREALEASGSPAFMISVFAEQLVADMAVFAG